MTRVTCVPECLLRHGLGHRSAARAIRATMSYGAEPVELCGWQALWRSRSLTQRQKLVTADDAIDARQLECIRRIAPTMGVRAIGPSRWTISDDRPLALSLG
jgi:hypothetical protein